MKDRDSLIQKIGNGLYMILVFLFVADPTNTVFGLKNIVFAILFIYSLVFIKPDWSQIRYFLICVFAVTISLILAVVQSNNINLAELKVVYTAFVPLLLLLWSDRYDVVRISYFPIALFALIVLVLFWSIFFFPMTEGPIYLFMWDHENTIMMSNRYILGQRFFCMYPKSAVAMIPILGYSLYNTITKERRTLLNILATVFLIHLFLISGTRSSVLFSMLLVFAILFVYCRNGRYARYIAYPLTAIFIMAFVVLLVALLMETDESSNMIKYAHLESYKKLFEENPLYLLLGQGPATDFYSEGFNYYSLRTEWTYLELIRNYGVMSLLIYYVLLRPFFSLAKYVNKDESVIVFILSYIIYLIVAGTNPLLFSSTGMLVVITMYSYVGQVKRRAVEALN